MVNELGFRVIIQIGEFKPSGGISITNTTLAFGWINRVGMFYEEKCIALIKAICTKSIFQ